MSEYVHFYFPEECEKHHTEVVSASRAALTIAVPPSIVRTSTDASFGSLELGSSIPEDDSTVTPSQDENSTPSQDENSVDQCEVREPKCECTCTYWKLTESFVDIINLRESTRERNSSVHFFTKNKLYDLWRKFVWWTRSVFVMRRVSVTHIDWMRKIIYFYDCVIKDCRARERVSFRRSLFFEGNNTQRERERCGIKY